MPPARDSEEAPVPIGGASGAAAFDGNHTNDLAAWLVPNDSWDDEYAPLMLDQLMDWTSRGHLGWVLVPPQGFRL